MTTIDDNSLVSKTLDEPGEGRVLVVDNSGSTSCAMLGGDLARKAAANATAAVARRRVFISVSQVFTRLRVGACLCALGLSGRQEESRCSRCDYVTKIRIFARKTREVANLLAAREWRLKFPRHGPDRFAVERNICAMCRAGAGS